MLDQLKNKPKKLLMIITHILLNMQIKRLLKLRPVTQFGTKAMMIAKGDVEFAKKLSDMMGNTKGPFCRDS